MEDDLYTSFDLDKIFDLPTIQHPGHDCFVMKKDIFKQVYLASVFLGNPPIAPTFHSNYAFCIEI